MIFFVKEGYSSVKGVSLLNISKANLCLSVRGLPEDFKIHPTFIPSAIFGSNRSPRRGDLVCACVRPSVILFKITVKMSSSSILKSPGGF